MWPCIVNIFQTYKIIININLNLNQFLLLHIDVTLHLKVIEYYLPSEIY